MHCAPAIFVLSRAVVEFLINSDAAHVESLDSYETSEKTMSIILASQCTSAPHTTMVSWFGTLMLIFHVSISHAADDAKLHAAGGNADSRSSGNVIATVNGKPVSRAMLDVLIKARAGDSNPFDESGSKNSSAVAKPPTTEERIKMIGDLITTELIAQKAKERKIDQRPEVIAEAELQYKSFLQQLLVRDIISEIRIDESEIAERYKQQAPEKMYQVSHILTPDEAAAKAGIAEITKGADFAAVSRKRSTDAQSKKDGSLGWIMLNEMAAPFASAVRTLKPGETTRNPVKTVFGWHVIRLQAMRDIEKPALTEVRPTLRQNLLVEKVNERIQKMSKEADIKILTR